MLFWQLKGLWKKEKKKEAVNEFQRLLDEIDLAKMEWNNSLQHFQYADHPDMVEYIVYYIKAAEKKYMYLLNQYKNQYKDYHVKKGNND
ncbi:DUF2508 family protein [Tepidibacillus sp. LV47]|uniref:DUF2508 family protein n=1 Tax=Tepidibacillus sp. LV47 TaxID=3398228 RepID=UPI003AAD040B